MFEAYMNIYKAEWHFFIHYGWKILLVMAIIFAIVIWLKNRK